MNTLAAHFRLALESLGTPRERYAAVPTTYRWLGRQLFNSQGHNGPYTAGDQKHWTEKARRVVAAQPKTPQEVQDAVVNFPHMRGAPVHPSHARSYEKLIGDMQNRTWHEELPPPETKDYAAESDEPFTLQPPKPTPAKPVFGGKGKASQGKLFGTEGLPGERNLFATPGVPDEDVYKPKQKALFARALSRELYAKWNESEHPRADDGTWKTKPGHKLKAGIGGPEFRSHDYPTFLTGAHSDASGKAAEHFGDLGLLITPDTAGYVKHIDRYATYAVDNGVFGGKFSEEKFRKLLDRIKDSSKAAELNCMFVVAPDVFDRKTMTGDALKTIERSKPWFKEIRDKGFPAALVAQDGLEEHPEKIPWDEFDALFIGGGDSFKEGYRDEPPLFSAEKRKKWKEMIEEAHKRGKHVHVGRVNGLKRFQFAYEIGADSVDGTYLAFGPKKNLPKLLDWMNNLRSRERPDSEPRKDDLLEWRKERALGKEEYRKAFAVAFERYDKLGWNEADHPRGQPENAGQFTTADRANMHTSLTKTGSASHANVNVRITQHPAGKHRGHAVEWTENGTTTTHAPKAGLQFRDAVSYAINKMWRTRGVKGGTPAEAPAPPKTDFGPGVKTLPDGRKVGMAIVTVADLAADPARFQYKVSNIDSSTGTTQELKEVQRFRPEFAGMLLVWHDPKDGKTYVVNGHHRFELARRAGYTGPLSVNLIDAKDEKGARAIGALANVAEGRGTALDAAKYFRESGQTPASLAAEGVSLKGKIADDGIALSKASDTIFSLLANKRLDESRALAIVKGLEDKPDVQDDVLREVESAEARGRSMPDQVVRELTREAALAPTKAEEIRDLFGSHEQMRSLRVERAEIKAHLRKTFARDATIFGEITRKGRAERLGEAGNVINEEANKQKAQEASTLKWLYEKLANNKGELSDAINHAAEEYAASPKRKRELFAGIERIAAETLRREWQQHAPAPGAAVPAPVESPAAGSGAGVETYSKRYGGGGHEGYRPQTCRLAARFDFSLALARL